MPCPSCQCGGTKSVCTLLHRPWSVDVGCRLADVTPTPAPPPRLPQYSHGRTSLLAVQIDAAINSGNSGGPVLLKDEVVGIAFQCLTSGENIGYIIPTPVIEHFLTDLSRNSGKYTGGHGAPSMHA
jgi:hypothetical protein